MRSLIRSLILQDAALMAFIPADRWFSAGSVDESGAPPTPFAVIRLGTVNRGMAHIKRYPMTFWIHDEPGDYGTIEAVLERLRGILDGVEHVQGHGAAVMTGFWDSDSGDLSDAGFRTITKNTSYTFIGTGA